ncbi:hypothetical protein AGMMS49965_03270 [Bacteroidia bacterium]|nr:hypothetical protein AGMMS49965_03270 [Bacteroidia bacterium]
MAQTTNTEYFVSSSYTRTNLNPALRPANGYVGFPGLTNFSLDYRTNTFNLENFLFPGKGDDGKKTATFLHPNVTSAEFLKNIADANFLALDINETILGFGFYAGDMFWNFDLSARVFGEANVPYDFFAFVKKGLQSNQAFDFKDLSLSATAFAQAAVGASLPLLDDKLMVGAKVKVLAGVAAASFNIDRLRFDLGEGGTNVWKLQTQASLQVHAPGVKAVYKNEDGKEVFDDIDFDFKPAPSGWGLGVDLGGVFDLGYFADSYEFLENFSVSAAVTDIGFISWNKGADNFVSLVSDPTEVTLLGDKVIEFSDEESLDDIFNGLEDKLKDVKNLKNGGDSKALKGMGLRSKMNIGIDYAFPSFPANVGILSTTHFNPSKTFTELTLGGSIRPIKKGLELGASYSLVYGDFQKFGVSLHLGNFFFVSSDYLLPKVNSSIWQPVSVKGLNVQLGIAIPLSGSKKGRSIDATPITPKPKKEKPKKEDEVPPVEIPVEAPIETPVEEPVETPVINVLIDEPVTTTTTIQY